MPVKTTSPPDHAAAVRHLAKLRKQNPIEREKLAADLAAKQKAYDEWRHPQIEFPRAEPARRETASGRILVRVPKSVHAALLTEAKEEGTSLNQLILAKLSIGLSVAGR